MDAAQQAKAKAMISRALSGSMASPLVPAIAPASIQPAPAPVQANEPTYPPEVPLDEYEALMVDALGWRAEASEKTQAILNSERGKIIEMKNKLLRRCINRLQIDISQYNLIINSQTGMIKIEKRG